MKLTVNLDQETLGQLDAAREDTLSEFSAETDDDLKLMLLDFVLVRIKPRRFIQNAEVAHMIGQVGVWDYRAHIERL